MQREQECGKIKTIKEIVGGEVKIYLACPRCRKSKVARLYPETEATRLGVFCKRCGESVVDIPKLVPVP